MQNKAVLVVLEAALSRSVGQPGLARSIPSRGLIGQVETRCDS